MGDFVEIQAPQKVSEIDLLPRINPEHEAFFLQFVPSKYYTTYGHRDLNLVSIRLSANSGETVAVYEIDVPACHPDDCYVYSYEYRIRNGKLVEKNLGRERMNRRGYLASRVLAAAKYGKK